MTEMGRRERKKAQTRQSLADAAMRLFTERGYEQVTVAEVADAADVSVTTLFNHFPGGKESLVFDEDSAREAGLVRAVTERAPGQSVLDGLRAYASASPAMTTVAKAEIRHFVELVNSAPALREYSQQMTLRHADALGKAIAAETGSDEFTAKALARCVLDMLDLSHDQRQPRRAVNIAFDLLENGWGDYGKA